VIFLSSSERNNVERVGEITGEQPANKAVDVGKASKLANLLEGLEFPATKEEISNHIKHRQPKADNIVLDAIEKNLDERGEYGSAYEVEVEAGLVKANVEKPYVRDKALNRANRKRMGEKIRPDPYIARENISPASARDVSPNTPTGEEV